MHPVNWTGRLLMVYLLNYRNTMQLKCNLFHTILCKNIFSQNCMLICGSTPKEWRKALSLYKWYWSLTCKSPSFKDMLFNEGTAPAVTCRVFSAAVINIPILINPMKFFHFSFMSKIDQVQIFKKQSWFLSWLSGKRDDLVDIESSIFFYFRAIKILDDSTDPILLSSYQKTWFWKIKLEFRPRGKIWNFGRNPEEKIWGEEILKKV